MTILSQLRDKFGHKRVGYILVDRLVRPKSLNYIIKITIEESNTYV